MVTTLTRCGSSHVKYAHHALMVNRADGIQLEEDPTPVGTIGKVHHRSHNAQAHRIVVERKRRRDAVVVPTDILRDPRQREEAFAVTAVVRKAPEPPKSTR